MEDRPTKPNWRWLTYQALLGRDEEGIDDAVLVYARELKKEHSDKKIAPFKAIDAVEMLKHEKRPNPHISRAMKLRDEKPIRDCIRHMLLEQCGLEMVQEAVYHKFKESLDEETIRVFRDFWWDTHTLNAYEIGQYFAGHGESLPDPPPVSGRWRSGYRAFEAGVQDDEFDLDGAMERMFQRAFYRSEELAKYKGAADDRVMKFQKNAMQMYRALHKARQDRKDSTSEVELPEVFEEPIEYPEQTATTIHEINGYDPNEDPNDE